MGWKGWGEGLIETMMLLERVDLCCICGWVAECGVCAFIVLSDVHEKSSACEFSRGGAYLLTGRWCSEWDVTQVLCRFGW